MTWLSLNSVEHKSTSRTVGKNYQSFMILLLISLALLGGLGSRLAYMQLVRGQSNRLLADKNRIRLIPKRPERGSIFDRKGKLLATNRLSRSVYLWPLAHQKEDWQPTFQRLGQILNMPESEILQRLEKAGANSPALVLIARDLTPEQIVSLEEHKQELTGVEVEIEAVRDYPNKNIASHVLGYTGEINDAELSNRKDQPEKYRLGDVIGKMGVEAAFEPQLRGEWGGREVEVDGKGKILRILGERAARRGEDIHLTIDLDLQKAAEEALGNNNGAILAMNPKNGAILAMGSHPGFDPNLLSNRVSQQEWDRLQRAGTFLNRALRAFPPASTFKIVTTTAGIESGKFSPDTVLQTYAGLKIGGVWFADWNRAGFGPLGFPGALAWSSDTFFYQIGKGVGGPKLIEWTRKYGFGQKTGIELETEDSTGLVADDDWKQRQMNIPWSVGDTVNMSIGQGFLLATPVQVAVMFSVPANGGYRVKPHLLKDNEEAKSWRVSMDMKPDTVKVIRQGLRRVVAGGTGKVLNVPSIPPASGKSGTSEVARGKLPHTWFGAYAPSENPEIVAVCFGEHSGGGGGSFCAPRVLKVLEAYFRLNQPGKAKVKDKTTQTPKRQGRRYRG